MSFNIILATDKNYGIAKDHKIPWYFSEDLKHFNSTTKNHIIIMGRYTADELEKALPNRINIVITSSESYNRDGFISVGSLEAALRVANDIRLTDGKEIFICGGRNIYNECLKSNKIKKIYYTHINKSFDCDICVDSILDNPKMNYTIVRKSIVDDVELTYYEIELICV